MISEAIEALTRPLILRQPAAVNWRAYALLIALIVAVVMVNAVWLAASPLSLRFRPLLIALSAAALLGFLAFVYVTLRPVPRLAVTLLSASILAAFPVAVGVLNYLALGLAYPLQDELFASWDQQLGFDWIGYVAMMARHPYIATGMSWLYKSSIVQIGLLTLVLGFSGHFRALSDMMAVIVIAGIATVLFGSFLPALGPYHHYQVADHGIAFYVNEIKAVHDGLITTIPPNEQLTGLVFFPSYHTVLSVILILAGWQVAYLRYPVLIANVVLIAGVPVYGGHYLADVIAGGLLAVVVYCGWRRAFGLEQHSALDEELKEAHKSFAN